MFGKQEIKIILTCNYGSNFKNLITQYILFKIKLKKMEKKSYLEKSLRNIFLSKRSSYIFLYMILLTCGQDAYSADYVINKPQINRIYNYFALFDNVNIKTENTINPIESSTCLVCPQADITITTSTPTYSNGSLTLCPGQKVIVESGATLILDNFTFQAEIVSPLDRWDGIVLKSGASLIVRNNSVVKESVNGITAEEGFNSINLLESSIINNNMVIDANPSSSSQLFPIYILKSTLSNSSSSLPGFVKLNGVNMNSIKSNFINVGNVVSGIIGFNNRIAMQYCRIANFISTGIHKNAGGGFENSSLYLYSCDIMNCPTSIIVSDNNVVVQRCLLQGGVVQSGRSTGTWRSNNFLASLFYLSKPELSVLLSDNQFAIGKLNLFQDQSLTDAKCNYWAHCNTSVDGLYLGNHLDSWGSLAIASGNYHTTCSPLPPMDVSTSKVITNYHKDMTTHRFDYLNDFDGVKANAFPTCPGNWRILEDSIVNATTGTYTELEYDNTNNNNLWLTHNEAYQDAITELNGADPSTNPALRTIIENSLVGMGQCVAEAMAYGIESMTTSQINVWSNRADPLVNIRKQIMQLLFAENYSGLITYLNSLSLSGENSADRDLLVDGISWMQEAIDDEKDLYYLSSTDLDELSAFADQSYGNYTEVLRGWLNIHYNIFFDEFANYNLESIKNKIEPASQLDKVLLLNSSQIDCIRLYSQQGIEATIEVIGIDGQMILSNKIKFSGEDCFPADLKSGIYIIRLTSNSLEKPIIYSYLVP